MFGKIDDDAFIDGLTALRSAAAARRDDPAVAPGNAERAQRFVHGPGNHDPRRHDLIKRSVGGIAAAVEWIEQDVARNFAPKTRGKGAGFSRMSRLFGPRRRHWFNLV